MKQTVITNEINLELRSQILEIALTLENSINKLITVYLEIEHPDPKTIGNKNSSISFKSKLDLLSDLEILSKEEYSKLLLVMEFRNQFLHNLNCDSFIVAIELLGSDRGKQLLKFDDLEFEANQELRYNSAYKRLFLNSLDIILVKYAKRKEEIAEKREAFLTISNYINYCLDNDEEIIQEILLMCMPHNGDDAKLSNFKSCVSSFISGHIERSILTDNYKQLKSKLESIDSIYLEQLFKKRKNYC